MNKQQEQNMQLIELGKMVMRVEVNEGRFRVMMKLRDLKELARPMAAKRMMAMMEAYAGAQESGWTEERKSLLCSNFLVLWFMALVYDRLGHELEGDEETWVWTDVEVVGGKLQ